MITIEKIGNELNPWKVLKDEEVIGKIEMPAIETTEDGHTVKAGYQVVFTDGSTLNCWEQKCETGVQPFTHQHIINCVTKFLGV